MSEKNNFTSTNNSNTKKTDNNGYHEFIKLASIECDIDENKIEKILKLHDKYNNDKKYSQFIGFVSDWTDLDIKKIKIMSSLYKNCISDFDNYLKYNNDTTSREILMDSISMSLIGVPWITYGDDKEEKEKFIDKMRKYEKD